MKRFCATSQIVLCVMSNGVTWFDMTCVDTCMCAVLCYVMCHGVFCIKRCCVKQR